MKKLYRVKEVRKYTGLSRKELFELEESIPPTSRVDNAGLKSNGEERKGYKLYDKKSLEKLCIASFFKELGLKPKEINEKFKSRRLNKKKLFDEIIKRAKQEKQRAEDIINVVEIFEETGVEGITINPFVISDLHNTASKINYSNEPNKRKQIEKAMDNDFNDALLDIYSGFIINGDSSVNNLQLKKLIELSSEKIDINPNQFIFGQALVLNGVGKIAKYINSIREGLAKFISNYILDYLFDHLFDEIDDVIEKLENSYESNLSYSERKEYIDSIMKSIKKWLGFSIEKDGEEMMMFIEMMIEQANHDSNNEKIKDDYSNRMIKDLRKFITDSKK